MLRFSFSSGPLRGVASRYDALVKSGSIKPDPTQAAVARALDGLLYQSQPSGSTTGRQGAYIHGSVGSGKTTLMDLFYRTCIESGRRASRVHYHDFLSSIHKRLHERRMHLKSAEPQLLESVAIEYAREFRTLCLDECHIMNVSDALILRTFVGTLLKQGTVLVTTSNQSPDELYSAGINREVFMPFISEIEKYCFVLRLESHSGDYRQTSIRNAAGGFEFKEAHPPSHYCDELKLSDSRFIPCKITGSTISIDSELILATSGRMSALDFNAITAAGFARVEIHNIKPFSDEDSARRFASLIDVLYDSPTLPIFLYTSHGENTTPAMLFTHVLESMGVSEVNRPHLSIPTGKSVTLDDRSHSVSISVPGVGGTAGKHTTYVNSGADAANQMEWSATGRIGANMFDLTAGYELAKNERKLPILRCISRMEQIAKSSAIT